MKTALFALLSLPLLLPSVAPAQIVPVKSLPIATGDQFRFLPAANRGLGGLFIALDDPLLDPFVNPAKGARLRGTQLLVSPAFYGVSGDNGSARTLPLGILAGSGRWFGGGMAALQQLESGPRFGGVIILEPQQFAPFSQDRLSDRSASNMYAAGLVGAKLPDSRFSVGASAFLADLGGVQSVDQLYALSERIDQSGHLVDVRLGLLGELAGGRSLEALVLYNSFRMTHDVTYIDWVVTDSLNWTVEPQTRLETNRDDTDTWGVHLGYVAPIGSEGWRVGGILTGNWKTHPKIPNYEIANIPRDPGNTSAYNFGIGIVKTGGPATFGVDLIYEPIRSHTWAEADAPVQTISGATILEGDKTVDNRFTFSNAHIRMGVGYDVDPAGFQLGLQTRSIQYELRQHDLVQESQRQQQEHWMEWTPTWGLSLRLTDLEIRYAGQVTTGTGLPGVAWTGVVADRVFAAEASDFIVAPSGPLTLQEAHVVSHQISVSVPLGH